MSYYVSESPSFDTIIKADSGWAYATDGFSYQADVTGLKPNTTYYYHFDHLGSNSVMGRSRTAPAGSADTVKLAFVTCSNFQTGYFNAYAVLAKMDDLNAVVHLGDYIYEYGAGTYADTTLQVRQPIPKNEIVSLQDYRTRFAQYRTDPMLERLHRQHPVLAIWDDHEITNNAHLTGAQNHQPETEGDYQVRQRTARKNYFEWLPVRRTNGEALYRTVAFGELARIHLLDGRLAGRTAQAENINDPSWQAEERTFLGPEQLGWLEGELAAAKPTWTILGNPVILAGLHVPFYTPESPRWMDMWDGYPAAKRRLFNTLAQAEVENLVVMTGDFHSSMALNLPKAFPVGSEPYPADAPSIGVEAVVHSVSSPNFGTRMTPNTVAMWEARYRQANPHIAYTKFSEHGFVLLTLTPEAAIAEWCYLADIKKPTDEYRIGKRLQLRRGATEWEVLPL